MDGTRHLASRHRGMRDSLRSNVSGAGEDGAAHPRSVEPHHGLRRRLLRAICAAYCARHRSAHPRLYAGSRRNTDGHRRGRCPRLRRDGGQCRHQRRPAEHQGRDARRDAGPHPGTTGGPGRGRVRRPVRLGLCREEPGAQPRPLPAVRHRWQHHRNGQAVVHRLREPRHLRFGRDPPRLLDHQSLRRHGAQQAAGGRHRHPHRP
jgi:hypothetical protein